MITTLTGALRAACAAGLVAAGLGLAPAASAQTVLTASDWVPPSHLLHKDVMRVWAAEVEKATQGRVKVNFLPKHPSAPPGTFDAVRDGLTDVSFVTASYTPARHTMPIMPELPGGGATSEINSVAYWRIHQKHFEKVGEYKGVRLLTVWTHGPGQMFNNKKVIDSLDDLQGMKIRTGGGVAEQMARALGAAAFVKPSVESYELLSSGVADGTFFPAESVTAFKIDKVVKYATIFPGGFYNSAFGMFMNEDKFNKLPKQDQDAILSVSGEKLARLAGQAWDRADKAALEQLKTSGVQILPATPELVKGIQAKAAVLEQEWIKAANAKGVDGARALADFREELKAVAAGK